LKTRTIPLLQALILTVFLAGLPIGSWYYLREGYNYRKTLLNDLSDLGSLPASQLSNVRDSLISVESLNGKALLLVPIRTEDTTTAQLIIRLADQFAESKGLSFLLIGNTTPAAQQWADYFSDYDTRYPGLFIHLSADHPINTATLNTWNRQWLTHKAVAIVDVNSVVRRSYQTSDNQDLQRLVEHLAILIPGKSTPKPVIVRETEK
jgi:hypothetical protein